MFAWNFAFPTHVELILWRVASVFTLAFGVVGGGYSGLCHKVLLPKLLEEKPPTLSEMISRSQQSKGFRNRVSQVGAKMRNISPGQDPNLAVPLKVLIPMSIICACYCLCRLYLLIEDFIGLRKLPSSAFQTVDWSMYIPHL
jgi:hypothetical protein